MVLNVLAHFLQLCNNTIDPLLWVRWRVIAFFYNRLLYIDRKKKRAWPSADSPATIELTFCYKISLVWHFFNGHLFKAYRFMDFHLLSSNKKSEVAAICSLIH